VTRSRVSRGRILDQLRAAARKGDRSALQIALGDMRTLAYSPRYWERYLELLDNPLARLVDLLVIKQGDRIAGQKGWTLGRRRRRQGIKGAPASRGRAASGTGGAAARRAPPSRRARPVPTQPSLFPELG
jgi:hypothetical protein